MNVDNSSEINKTQKCPDIDGKILLLKCEE